MRAKNLSILLILFLFVSACEKHLFFEEKDAEVVFDGSASTESFREKEREEQPEITCVISCSEIIAGEPNKYYDSEGSIHQPYFYSPNSLVYGKKGEVFIADMDTHLIRVYHADTGLRTFAGTGKEGSQDGHREQATFYFPTSLVMDSKGNLFVGEFANRIRKISPEGEVSTLTTDATPEPKGGFQLYHHFGVSVLAIDSQDNLYLTDRIHHQIRKITPQGQITTIAGTGSHAPQNGPAHEAGTSAPHAPVIDQEGNLYFYSYRVIRKLSPEGEVTTFSGREVYGDRDGHRDDARFENITALKLKPDGSLLAVDRPNHRILHIDKQGYVTRLVGRGRNSGGFQIGETPETIGLSWPTSILIESEHTLLVSESSVVRRIYLKDCPCLPPLPSSP